MVVNENGKIFNGNTGTPIDPEAFNPVKFVWLTPSGKIKFMNLYNAKKWHPDWKLISKDVNKFNIRESEELF